MSFTIVWNIEVFAWVLKKFVNATLKTNVKFCNTLYQASVKGSQNRGSCEILIQLEVLANCDDCTTPFYENY